MTPQINSSLAHDLLEFYRFMESVDATGDRLDTLFRDMYVGTEEERDAATTAWAEYSVLLDNLREQLDALDAEGGER